MILTQQYRNQSHQVACHVNHDGVGVVVILLLIITCNQTDDRGKQDHSYQEQSAHS